MGNYPNTPPCQKHEKNMKETERKERKGKNEREDKVGNERRLKGRGRKEEKKLGGVVEGRRREK
jgi:hypothetical protein